MELALSQSLVSTCPAMAFKSCSRNSRLPVARIRRSMNWVRRSTKALDFVLPFLTGTCRNSSCYRVVCRKTQLTECVTENIKLLKFNASFFFQVELECINSQLTPICGQKSNFNQQQKQKNNKQIQIPQPKQINFRRAPENSSHSS